MAITAAKGELVMGFKRANLFIGSISVAVMLSIPVSAHAADSAVTANESTFVDDSGVVHYSFDPAALPGATISTDQGARGLFDGACEFNTTGSGKADNSRPFIEVGSEVSFDPATCTRELAIARYDIDSAPKSVTDLLDHEPGMETASHFESMGASDAAGVETWYVTLKAQLKDPINIITSETVAAHTWNIVGGVDHGNTWGWYAPTGWASLTRTVINTPLVTNTRGTFQNVAFCNPFLSTDVDHSITEVEGGPGPSYAWIFNIEKSGDCADLLSRHYVLIVN